MPFATVRAPEQFSSCADSEVSLDGSRSTGGGIKPLTYKWMAVPRECDNYYRVQARLDALGSVAVPLLRASELSGGVTFTIRLVVTDVFGVSSPDATVTVNRATGPIPAVEIESPQLVYVRSTGSVSLPARATLASCYNSLDGARRWNEVQASHLRAG